VEKAFPMTIQRLPAIRLCLPALLATRPLLAAAGPPTDWDACSRALADQLTGELKAELGAAIRKDSPDDAATGFEPGQRRGAVTVVWPAGH
jgi:hypothetical protein